MICDILHILIIIRLHAIIIIYSHAFNIFMYYRVFIILIDFATIFIRFKDYFILLIAVPIIGLLILSILHHSVCPDAASLYLFINK